MFPFIPFSIGQSTGHSGLIKMKTWQPFLFFSGENALFLDSLYIKKHFDISSEKYNLAILVQYFFELLFVCYSDDSYVCAAVILRIRLGCCHSHIQAAAPGYSMFLNPNRFHLDGWNSYIAVCLQLSGSAYYGGGLTIKSPLCLSAYLSLLP